MSPSKSSASITPPPGYFTGADASPLTLRTKLWRLLQANSGRGPTRGTGGSNPAPSSKESGTNFDRFWPAANLTCSAGRPPLPVHDADPLRPARPRRGDPAETRRTTYMPERLDEEELADWRAGRNAVYQLAPLTVGARLAVAAGGFSTESAPAARPAIRGVCVPQPAAQARKPGVCCLPSLARKAPRRRVARSWQARDHCRESCLSLHRRFVLKHLKGRKVRLLLSKSSLPAI